MKISHLMKDRRPLKVRVDDETDIEIVYQPSAFTAKTEDEFLGLTKDNRNSAAAARLAQRFVAQWNVTDDDGKPLPITLDLLESLPVEFTGLLVTAIFEDIRARGEARRSAAGS